MRKKLASVVFAAFMLAAFVCTAGAEDTWKRGGYTGPSSISVSKAKEVKNIPHDTDVVLEGKIERYLGNEKYQFNDGSDTIILEIDHEVWNGLEVGSDDMVILYGEVDRKFRRFEVEVERIEKKQS
ncbi:MAG: NirD/YgiW/YdeI family stress tolerance protein [Treponema sp.]|nr:NirD/YgiW/YdeI family stress tolerance protein [Treponema sp.]